ERRAPIRQGLRIRCGPLRATLAAEGAPPMTPRSSILGIAAVATLALLVGFVAGSFLATGGPAAPAFAAPLAAERRSPGDPAEPLTAAAPLTREAAYAAPASGGNDAATEAALALVRRNLDDESRP